jgi:hypothetical protein
LSMLNWRRDPGYEQRKMQHEWRMKQLESDILRVQSDSERIENDILQVRSDNERIESDILQVETEIEQIKKETEQLRQDNAREKALSASIRRLCFPPESSSTLPTPTGPDSKPSCP